MCRANQTPLRNRAPWPSPKRVCYQHDHTTTGSAYTGPEIMWGCAKSCVCPSAGTTNTQPHAHGLTSSSRHNSRHSSRHVQLQAKPASAAAVGAHFSTRQRHPPSAPLHAAPPHARGSSPPSADLPPFNGTLHASSSSSPATSTSQAGQQQRAQDPSLDAPLITFTEVQEVARRRGLCITLSTLGPFYRIVCRQPPADSPAASSSPAEPESMQGSDATASSSSDAGERGRVVAVTTGFVAPFLQLMHCDTLQVMTKGMRGEEGQRVRGTLGLGLLLGGAAFSHGLSCGCSKAEILAINDDDAWHERLVRYYRFFGFSPVCKVGGNGWSDLPHMLVWGGEGMRMDADVRQMLRKWTPALKRSLKEAQG